jgi:hypothetical protein
MTRRTGRAGTTPRSPTTAKARSKSSWLGGRGSDASISRSRSRPDSLLTPAQRAAGMSAGTAIQWTRSPRMAWVTASLIAGQSVSCSMLPEGSALPPQAQRPLIVAWKRMRSPSLASTGVSSLGVATTKSALTNDCFKEVHLLPRSWAPRTARRVQGGIATRAHAPRGIHHSYGAEFRINVVFSTRRMRLTDSRRCAPSAPR